MLVTEVIEAKIFNMRV